MFETYKRVKYQTPFCLNMTTIFIKHITFRMSLLIFVFLVFPVANAMPIKDMYAFCKETKDVNFCLKYIGTDIRILAARDLNDVLIIAVILVVRSLVCNYFNYYSLYFTKKKKIRSRIWFLVYKKYRFMFLMWLSNPIF